MKTIRVKIEKLEKINEGVMYIYYRATNTETNESRKSNSTAYYGSDIINLSSHTEDELNNLPIINGKKYSSEKVVSIEYKEYQEDNAEAELKKEGWSDEIQKAIEYVLY